MKKFAIFFIFCTYMGVVVFSQNSNNETSNTVNIPSEYNRNALSVLVLQTNSQYSNDLMAASGNAIISGKFDDNSIELHNIKALSNVNNIQQQLVKGQVVNQIISKWFSRDTATGEFDMMVIHERGMYNATDDEVREASASKIGLASLKDAGESLINRSYVLVMDFYDIETMRQVYNKQDVRKKIRAEAMNKNYQPVRRVKTGWVGNVRGYLYKINFNDSLINIFYNDLWIYEDDDEETKKIKKERFENSNFPIEFVTQVSGKADGSQYKAGHVMATPVQLTKNELFQKMINTGLSSCLSKAERVLDAFQVKAPVYKVKPISSKVGKKEGLKTDQRYFVMESYQNRKGEIDTKRKGIVRVKKVTDNREVATGDQTNYTSFYQVAGRKIEAGMQLHQKNDIGTGLSGGVSFGEIGGGWLKLEQNVALMVPGSADIGVTQLKLFGSMGFENKAYDVLNEGTKYDITFLRWQVGISKGFYFARNFSLAPFIAFGSESGSNSQMNSDLGLNSDDFIGADFFNYGISGSVNILHFLQVYASVNMYTFFGYTYTKQRHPWDYGKFNGTNYTDVFSGREFLSIDVGGRIEF